MTVRRRRFLGVLGGCAGYAAAVLAGAPSPVLRAFAACPRGVPAAKEPWGRLEELGEGIWALISTPLNDHPRANLTVANGGIISGRDGVAIVEGLGSADGASWLAEAARELTGRTPDHVVLTHFHGDHSNGLAAHGAHDGPALHATSPTVEALRESAAARDRPSVTAGFHGERLARADAEAVTRLDLGGRVLEIHGVSGHTRSDLFLTLEEPRITWCGDLVWNGLFPNYMHAIPTRLSDSVRRIAQTENQIWVPGHGDLADRAAVDRYVALIDDVEEEARRAFDAGDPPEEVAATYRPPDPLGEWVMFSPRYYEVAFVAWNRELSGANGGP